MKAVRFDKGALQELDQAADYYERQSLGLGARFIDRVSEAVDIITAYPQLFAMANGPYRCKLVRGFPYALYYREKDDTVIILAVAHTSRKPGFWLAR